MTEKYPKKTSLKDTDLKSQLQKYTGNEDVIIVNAARSPLEMQTSPCYCDIIIPTDKKFINKQCVFTHTFCDLQMPRYGRQQKDSPNFVSTWDFLLMSVCFVESLWDFSKNRVGSRGLESIHQPLGSAFEVFFYKLGK